jgi:hypothetical protein
MTTQRRGTHAGVLALVTVLCASLLAGPATGASRPARPRVAGSVSPPARIVQFDKVYVAVAWPARYAGRRFVLQHRVPSGWRRLAHGRLNGRGGATVLVRYPRWGRVATRAYLPTRHGRKKVVTPAVARTVTRFGAVSLRLREHDGDWEQRSVTSPNGRYWVVPRLHRPANTHTVEWVDTLTGVVVRLAGQSDFRVPSQVDDSGRVLMLRPGGPVLLQPRTGSQTPVQGLPGSPEPVALSGDGRFVVLLEPRGGFQGLVMVDTRDGSTRDIMGGTYDPTIEDVSVTRSGQAVYQAGSRFWTYGPNDAARRLIQWPLRTFTTDGDLDLSEDGRYLTFASTRALTAGDEPGRDVFQADLVSRRLRAVSHRVIRWRSGPTPGPGFSAFTGPVASTDGRYVSFVHRPDIAGESGPAQVFVWDRVTGRHRVVSRDVRGRVADADSVAGSVTSTGVVSFLSVAGNLAAPGAGSRSDDYHLFTWRP